MSIALKDTREGKPADINAQLRGWNLDEQGEMRAISKASELDIYRMNKRKRNLDTVASASIAIKLLHHEGNESAYRAGIWALNQLGPHNYERGATGKNGKFDCSSFVSNAAMAYAGVNKGILSHDAAIAKEAAFQRYTTATLGSNPGRRDLKKADELPVLKTGDVILTKGHASMVLANDREKGELYIIHAADKASGVIMHRLSYREAMVKFGYKRGKTMRVVPIENLNPHLTANMREELVGKERKSKEPALAKVVLTGNIYEKVNVNYDPRNTEKRVDDK